MFPIRHIEYVHLTVTSFSNVAHTYYCFQYTSYFVHNHITLNHVYTPLHFLPINLTDLTNLAAKWRIKQAIACIFPVFFYLASSDFNILFVFNRFNLSSYTNSRYIHIVLLWLVFVHPALITSFTLFDGQYFAFYDLKMFDGMIKIEFDKFYCDQSRAKNS